jgi:hypothetical protein
VLHGYRILAKRLIAHAQVAQRTCRRPTTVRWHADILAVQELTPELAEQMVGARIADEFPYQALRARAGGAGVGI